MRLQGFGLDGSLGGRLHVRARPGREMTASGALEVDGTYIAYGQKLEITRGRLVWSNGPISDPVLDVRAERRSARSPPASTCAAARVSPRRTVWTDPASSQSEAIAYLALGRPLASASRDESRQSAPPRRAVGRRQPARLAAGREARPGRRRRQPEPRAGRQVIGAGKYLSPRLYVGYGVSLLGTGQVLTLKYLLRKGFDIEIESSTVENRASVNWRKEK